MHMNKEAVKDIIVTIVVPAIAVVAAFWIAARYVRPAPPDTFVMATGPDGGAYHLFAQRYRDILQRDKITMQLKPTAGSIENLKLLKDPDSGVDVALIQAGVASGEPPSGLRSLGAIYYEPLWVFYRSKEEVEKLSQLSGKRLAVGPEGSGTRALALQLLKASGINPSNTTILPTGGNDAVKALLNGTVDATLMVASPDAPTVRALATASGVKLANLVQAEAFTRRFPYLSAVQLPRGALDLAADLPSRDMTLLTTTANLVVRADFHPALGFLLLQAATETHDRAGVLQKNGEFPAPRESEFVLADEAKRFYKSGTPFLQRYLPFWAANFIQRMAVLLLPLVAVLLPLVKVLPALIQWRYKSRVFKWYGELKHLETAAAANPDPAHLESCFKRLEEIENGVNHTRVGTHYSDYLYNLRMHVDLVRTRLRKLADQHPGA
jgi:TRAP transporter TAXI family solute receptor